LGQWGHLLDSFRSSLLRMLANRHDAHSKGRDHSSHSASDASHPDQAKRGAGNLLGVRPLVPDGFLSPDALLLEQHGLRNFFGQCEHEREDVFGDHRAMHFPRIRESDRAVDQFRKEHLVDCGTGSMNPAQTASGDKLFRPHGNSEYNFGVAQFRFNAFVTVAVGNLQTGELLGQALAEPWWQFPEIEAVMHQQEYFHRSEFNHKRDVGPALAAVLAREALLLHTTLKYRKL